MGIKTCIVSSERMVPCDRLNGRLGANSLYPMDCWERGRGVRRGVIHGRGSKAAVLNFCPWCGADLRPAFAVMEREEPTR